MKRWQYMLLLVLGIICLGLSLVTIVFARQNRQLQEAVQAQQAMINKGALSQQVGNNLLREMAVVAQSDEQMKKLLRDNGFTVSTSPPPQP
jgi:Na+-translocating ferredoxin:NAD+ oxidoreductase RnfG subunit